MNPELNPMDSALEQAIAEIRDEGPDAAVMEAAAARVWARFTRTPPLSATAPIFRR